MNEVIRPWDSDIILRNNGQKGYQGCYTSKFWEFHAILKIDPKKSNLVMFGQDFKHFAGGRKIYKARCCVNKINCYTKNLFGSNKYD